MAATRSYIIITLRLPTASKPRQRETQRQGGRASTDVERKDTDIARFNALTYFHRFALELV